MNNDFKQGALIVLENLEKMPMPMTLDIKMKSGKVERIKLPVEVWERNNRFTFKYASREEVQSVTVDPDRVLPDSNSENNIWRAGN